MSINPAAGINPVEGSQSAEANERPLRPWPGVIPKPTSNAPEGEKPAQREDEPPSAKVAQELPEDQVQVQRDSVDGEIVIKYLDRSGDVVLQVPSSQMLRMTRAIDSDFQEEAKVRDEGRVSGGDKDHGH